MEDLEEEEEDDDEASYDHSSSCHHYHHNGNIFAVEKVDRIPARVVFDTRQNENDMEQVPAQDQIENHPNDHQSHDLIAAQDEGIANEQSAVDNTGEAAPETTADPESSLQALGLTKVVQVGRIL